MRGNIWLYLLYFYLKVEWTVAENSKTMCTLKGKSKEVSLKNVVLKKITLYIVG